MLDRLPFRELWAIDFEYRAVPGDRPVPVCLVAKELRSGRLLRLWQDQLPARTPFPVDHDTLIVSYATAAELGCFLELGWPLPARVLDLYAEFCAITNGRPPPGGRTLLSALSCYGLPAITSEEKATGRHLAMLSSWTPAERAALLDYCQTDVDPLGPLLERMLPAILARPKGLGQALLRGRYTAAVARMEQAGVPIDIELLEVLRDRWEAIKLDLIAEVDRDYGVFDGATFKADRFEAWLAKHGIPWPRTESGRLALDQETFRQAARTYPMVAPLRELRHSLSELRLEKLAVGPDGRNRVGLRPFAARSGRNTPSSARYIFGPSVWLRGLIRPTEGQALAYIDWSSQEIVIAAALSGDTALLEAVRSGDPYLRFAKLAGLAPAEATKESHKEIRDLCKTCMLGTNYGMGAHSLALRTGSSLLEAERLLRSLARTFPTFWEWAEYTTDAGQLTGQLATVFGWPLHVTATTLPTTLRNFPMQANAAEMLRIASCLTTEAGVTVCAPVHDALLVESKEAELGDVVNLTRALMAEASRKVLAGVEVATDVTLVRWPGRYADPRGAEMFQRVTRLLAPRWVEGAASASGIMEGSSSL